MAGMGRHRVLAVRSIDPVLSVAGTIGLAGSLGTALVIDLERREPITGRRTLRDLIVDGPTLDELSPGRPGIALLAGGEVAGGEVGPIVEKLSERWPAVALRVSERVDPFPIVPLVPIYPGRLLQTAESRGVWQPISPGLTAPGPGPVLPRLRPGLLRRVLAGHIPRKSRWVDAWRPVWEMPWA